MVAHTNSSTLGLVVLDMTQTLTQREDESLEFLVGPGAPLRAGVMISRHVSSQLFPPERAVQRSGL